MPAVYGRKYRTLSSSYEPERGKRKVWPTSKQAFSKARLVSAVGGRRRNMRVQFDPPEGRNARRFFDHLSNCL